MFRSNFCFGLIAISICFLIQGSEPTMAQGFSKSNRGGVASSVANPQRIKTPAQTQRESNYRNQNRNRSPKFNHHMFYPSRQLNGNGHRYSSGHFRGQYVPLVPFGYVDPYAYDYGYGYGAPIYDPYVLGYRYNSFGPRNLNPAYSTYGTYLNSGGVLGSNVIGSSVAAQALERLRNQQPIVPQNQNANSAQQAEILRLQIELERAKQQLAAQQQNPMVQQQKAMKPAVQAAPQSDNQTVIDQLGLAPIIETNKLAASSQLKAERAFRSGDYGQAARFAGLAKSLDDTNGKLMLFVSQAHFANAEFPEAVSALEKASSMLASQDMGWLVENFKLFYGQNDFVGQIQQLSNRLEQFPSDAKAWLLRGYQYGALGYPEAAKRDLEKAKSLGADSDLADTLLSRFAGAR